MTDRESQLNGVPKAVPAKAEARNIVVDAPARLSPRFISSTATLPSGCR